MNKYDLQGVSKQELEQIHAATVDVLENVGIEFRYQPALDLFQKNGAKVEGQKVFISEKMLSEALKTVPAKFTLHARNPSLNVTVGEDIVLCPGYGAPFVQDIDRGRRKATLDDFENFAKLAGMSKSIDLTGGVLVEPNDIPEKRRPAQMVYSSIINSEKCFMGSATGAENARTSIEMARILHGEADLAEKPALITLVNSITPLIWDDRMLGAMMEHVAAGQAVIVASLAMSGATSPGTLVGTLVVQNAEVLAGIVLTQLLRLGSPAVYGSASSITEMKYGTLAIGAPEMGILLNASAKLAEFYGIPSRGGGAVTDSKQPDAQAGYESMMNLLSASHSGIKFVLHAAGILEYYMTMCYEKFVIDEEVCGYVKRFARGFEVNEDSLAKEVIHQVGSGGHYLDKDHTFSHFRTEFYHPDLSDRGTFDHWTADGELDLKERANKVYKEKLAEFEAPALEQIVQKQLQSYMEKI